MSAGGTLGHVPSDDPWKKRIEELERKVAENINLRAELKRYTSWQPSDPGTKEAIKTCRPQSDEEGEKRMSWVDTAMTLSRALTAAMVRLEEAEKKGAYDWKAKALELAHLLGDIQEGVSSDGVLAWSEVEMKAWHKAVGQAMEIKS